MKHRRVLIFSLLVVALLVGGCGLWVRQAKRQYALNRQLIGVLAYNDYKQALVLVNQGADPDTFQRSSPPPFHRWFNQLLPRTSALGDDTAELFIVLSGNPTAFMLACGRGGEADDGSLLKNRSPDNLGLLCTMLAKGANVNWQDSRVGSPLLFAVCSGDTHLTRLLLAHGANPNQADAREDTPLSCAKRMKRPDMVAILNKGAK